MNKRRHLLLHMPVKDVIKERKRAKMTAYDPEETDVTTASVHITDMLLTEDDKAQLTLHYKNSANGSTCPPAVASKIDKLQQKKLTDADMLYVVGVAFMRGYVAEFDLSRSDAYMYCEAPRFYYSIVRAFIQREFPIPSIIRKGHGHHMAHSMTAGLGKLADKFVAALHKYHLLVTALFPSCMNLLTRLRCYRLGVSAQAFQRFVADVHVPQNSYDIIHDPQPAAFIGVVTRIYADICSGKLTIKPNNVVTVQEHQYAVFSLMKKRVERPLLEKKADERRNNHVKVKLANANVRYDVTFSIARSSFRSMEFFPSCTEIFTQLELLELQKLGLHTTFPHSQIMFHATNKHRLTAAGLIDIHKRVWLHQRVGAMYRRIAETLDIVIRTTDKTMWKRLGDNAIARSARSKILWMEAISWYNAATCTMIGGDYFRALLDYDKARTGMARQFGHKSREFAYFLLEAIHMSINSFQFAEFSSELMEDLEDILYTSPPHFARLFVNVLTNLRTIIMSNNQKLKRGTMIEEHLIAKWMNKSLTKSSVFVV